MKLGKQLPKVGQQVKRWAAVEVIWNDAHGGDEGWTRVKPRHSKPAPIRSVGMLARDSADCVVLFLSHDYKEKFSAAYISIPKVNVVRMRELS